MKIADATSNYQDKVFELVEILARIEHDLAALDTCAYSKEDFTKLLQSIQNNVDQLSYGSFSNQTFWMEAFDKKVCKYSLMVYDVFRLRRNCPGASRTRS